ncbi:hypothetical protein HanIR_Chr17g0895731 [Helianthus annuus]|nr:hypothetical protein HanIR_Chr17g0895731 [Helianthus annuus]
MHFGQKHRSLRLYSIHIICIYYTPVLKLKLQYRLKFKVTLILIGIRSFVFIHIHTYFIIILLLYYYYHFHHPIHGYGFIQKSILRSSYFQTSRSPTCLIRSLFSRISSPNVLSSALIGGAGSRTGFGIWGAGSWYGGVGAWYG